MKIRYFFEAGFLHFVLFIFGMMSPTQASNVGGWLGRNIGSKLSASRKAMRNLENAMPDLSAAKKDAIIIGMWDNLGRLVAEYPHLEKIAKDHTKIEGLENLKPYTDGKRSAIFIGGHFSNFEIPALCAYLQQGLVIDSTYRAPNNPYVHDMLQKIRSLGNTLKAHAKSQSGGRSLLKAAKGDANIGILIDQKYNEGINVAFMGMDAMTNPAFVQIAQKYGQDIVPMRAVRGQGCNFTFMVDQPMNFSKNEAVADIILRAHIILEHWVKENPDQWLWLHRRWDTQVTKTRLERRAKKRKTEQK